MNVKPSFLDRHPSLVNIPVGLGGIVVFAALIYAVTFCAGHGTLAVGRVINLHPTKVLDHLDVCLVGMSALCCTALILFMSATIGRDIIKALNDSRSDR